MIIDVFDLIIIEEKIKKPEERRETVSLLFNKKILSKNLVPKLEGLLGFRNILVYEYGKIDRKKFMNI